MPGDDETTITVGKVTFFRQYESWQYPKTMTEDDALRRYQAALDAARRGERGPVDPTLHGAFHCSRDVLITWSGLDPVLKTPPRALPRTSTTISLTNASQLDFRVEVPAFGSLPGYTVKPTAKITSVSWTPDASQGVEPCVAVTPSAQPAMSASVLLDNDPRYRNGCSVKVSMTWHFTFAYEGRPPASASASTPDEDSDPAFAVLSATEIRAIYTDGSTGSEGRRRGGTPTTTTTVAPGRRDGGTGDGRTRRGGYTCRPSDICVYDLPAEQGIVYAYTNTLRCAFMLSCDERLARAGWSVDQTGKPHIAVGQSRSGATGNRGNSGFDAKLGGLGFALLALAVLAVAGFVFFGRRHRL